MWGGFGTKETSLAGLCCGAGYTKIVSLIPTCTWTLQANTRNTTLVNSTFVSPAGASLPVPVSTATHSYHVTHPRSLSLLVQTPIRAGDHVEIQGQRTGVRPRQQETHWVRLPQSDRRHHHHHLHHAGVPVVGGVMTHRSSGGSVDGAGHTTRRGINFAGGAYWT